MLFNSAAFFVFFILFFGIYYLTRGRLRLFVILTASCVFYAWWDWRFLFLLGFIIVTDFAAALGVVRCQSLSRRKLLMLGAVASNLILLGFFKYFNFFTHSAAQLLGLFGMHADVATLRIILPVGISFYTFMGISYVVDVYKGKIAPEPSLLRFASFVSFFPHLVAGPIVRGSLLLPQLQEDRTFSWDDFYRGLTWVIWGYFLKVGVADSIALVVDITYAHPQQFTSSALLMSTFFYSFQVYGDFAGYSGIAIGLARMLGLDFGVNFNKPYFATSMPGFWKRWHMSLSSWLRDYIYIPLGGSRHGKAKTYRNSFLTMLACGLWHGAGLNYVVWGGLHGIYLVSYNLVKGPWNRLLDFLRCPARVRTLVAMGIVFAICCLTRIFFRAHSMDDALLIFRKIFTLEDFSIGSMKYKLHIIKGLLLIAFMTGVDWLDERRDFLNRLHERPAAYVGFHALVLGLIFLFGNFFANAFIYFAF